MQGRMALAFLPCVSDHERTRFLLGGSSTKRFRFNAVTLLLAWENDYLNSNQRFELMKKETSSIRGRLWELRVDIPDVCDPAAHIGWRECFKSNW